MPTLDSATLSAWYRSRPQIRRLLATRGAEGLRVLVQLEPAHDSSETYPVWLANRRAWVDELQLQTGGAVRLEHLDEDDDLEADDCEEVIVLSWRAPAFL